MTAEDQALRIPGADPNLEQNPFEFESIQAAQMENKNL